MDAFQLVVEHSNILMPGLRGSWLCVVYSMSLTGTCLEYWIRLEMQVYKQINGKKYNTM